MKYVVALFVLMMALWLLLSGHYTGLLITFGVLSCAGVVALARRMGIVDGEAIPIELLGRATRYVPWILGEAVKSNIDVAKRILDPEMPISPEIFEVKPSQKTDLGRVLYANSITLTPGTVTIRAYEDRLIVHAIAREVADDLRKGEMDRRVTWLEGAE